MLTCINEAAGVPVHWLRDIVALVGHHVSWGGGGV